MRTETANLEHKPKNILSHKKQTPPCAPGIQEHVEISTKKKGTQSENEDGTNSFGVHIVKLFLS